MTATVGRSASGFRTVVSAMMAVVTAITTIVVLPAMRATGALPVGAMSAAQVATMFATYGDAGGHWTGGDSTVSVALPDGRVAWLFSDTFLGTVNADRSRPPNTPMVNNTLVVQDGTSLVDTRHGGTAFWPEALVRPSQEDEFFWVADGIVESGALKVLYNRYRRYGSGSLEVELTGTSLATFALPALTLTSVVDLPVGKAITWGAAMLVDGSYTYVYGTSGGLGWLKFGDVARAPVGGLGGAWQFWTGTAWSGTESAAARLLSGVGNAFAVQKVGSQYVLVTQETNFLFDPQFVAYTAPSPTGPFTGPIPLLTAPEQQPGNQRIVYAARLHPDLARPGKLLMSYDVNSTNAPDLYADVRIYRPRFVELDWPRPPAAPLAAPGGLTVSADPAGVVHLQWTAVAGATGYHVHRRDVTGGQTHFGRQWQRVTQPSADIAGLVTGHRYEFKVTAANTTGEGPFSATVTATSRTVRDASVINLANTPEAVPGMYIVRLKDTPTVRGAGVEALARELLAQCGGTLDRLFPLTLRGFSARLTEAQAIDMAGHPDVLDVEQDQVVTLDGDQHNPPSWGLDRFDQHDLPLDQLYRYPNDAHDIRAFVIDTGVRITHPTFGGRATPGKNTVNNTMDSDDCNGHGTHVAGTIGGDEYGAAKRVRIIAVKVFDCGGRGTSTSVSEGVEWATARPERPAVVNMSLSVPQRDPRANSIDKAVQGAIDAGLTVVATAGNVNSDACTRSPARVPGVITVGNVDDTDHRHLLDAQRGSGFGLCVDLFAPGTRIKSADYQDPTRPATMTGTSMAAPHVAGVAAMILQTHRSYGAADVQDALRKAATPGKVVDPGVGTPNLLLFVEQPPEDPPLGLVALPNADGTIGLSWAPVLAPNLHYLVSQRDATVGEPFKRWGTPVTVGISAVATGLQEGHTYEFTVAAANSTGIGPESNVASAVAHTQPPGPPTDLVATANPNDGTIALAWKTPASNVWFNVYMRNVSANETGFTKLPIPITTCCAFTAGLLKHNDEYEFRVTAINQGGEGPPSNTVRARSHYPVPAPPTGLTAIEGDGEVTLRWTASPTPNVWYWVYLRDVSAQETEFSQLPLPITTCCTFTGGLLKNDTTYEFKVTAIGQGGESAPSNTVRATPHKPIPGQVTGLAAVSNSDGTITLRWTQPAGGPFWYEIYLRNVTANEAGFTKLSLPIDCCVFTAGLLTHNNVYEFKVGATNGRAGPLSDPVRATSRYGLPGPPLNLRGQAAGDGTVDLDWDPPGNGNFYYWLFWRNASTGQSFIKSGLPTDKTSATLGPFVHGDVYEFKVSAHNQGGEGPATAPIQVTSRGGLPLPPSGLTAQPGDGKVTLRWTASPTANVWYWVEQRPAGGSWTRLGLPVGSCCTFEVGWLANGTTYEFRFRSTNASGDSIPSNVASARPMPPFPQPPSGLTAQAGNGTVTLRWTASPTPNVWYLVDMRANGGAWQRLPAPLTECCAWTGGLLVNGTTYEFRLRATNLSGESAPSNVVSARPMPPFPQPPTGLVGYAGDAAVTLTWNASPTPNVWYWVEMRPAGGNWSRLPYPIVNCCRFDGGWLANGTTYEFRVRSTNLAGDSAPSNVASARPMPPVPNPPTNLHARGGFEAVDLTWSPSSTTNVMYYYHYRNITRNGPWVKSIYPFWGTSRTISYLEPGETYDFKVTAATYWFESAPSNIARATTIRTGCRAVPITPYVANLGDVQVGNLTACIGPVYNVTVIVHMWAYHWMEGWRILHTTSDRWGLVHPYRIGVVVARGSDGPPRCFITQATTRWSWSNGRAGNATAFSPTTFLGQPGYDCSHTFP